MDKQILKKLVEDGKNTREIAKETNKSQTTVCYWLRKYELKTKGEKPKKTYFSGEERKEAARRKSKRYYNSDKWPTVNCIKCGKEKKRRRHGTRDEFCAECWLEHIKSTKSRTGYQYVVPIEHFGKLDTAGKIHTHRFIAELVLNRGLNKDETVHHIDNDSFNNEPWNLCVLSNPNHASYHNWVRKSFCLECSESTLREFAKNKQNIIFLKDLTIATRNELVEGKIKINSGGKEIRRRKKKRFLGGPQQTKINWPTPEKMKELLWEKPTIQLAAELGVSDKAIDKFCKKNKIEKPPRGYWRKVGTHKLTITQI